jgi:hypothetical protein
VAAAAALQVGWAAMFGHVTDIGGKVACSMPNDAHSIFEVRKPHAQPGALPTRCPLHIV